GPDCGCTVVIRSYSTNPWTAFARANGGCRNRDRLSRRLSKLGSTSASFGRQNRIVLAVPRAALCLFHPPCLLSGREEETLAIKGLVTNVQINATKNTFDLFLC